MREQVEHADGIGPCPHRHKHVAKLRTGRIGNDALDVVLDETDGRREEGRRGANEHHHRLCARRQFKQGGEPGHHEHAGGDHGRRMYQGRDGRRPLHRVRSHVCSRNWADLPMAPMNSSKQISVSASACQPKKLIVFPVSPGAPAKIVSKSVEPISMKMAKMPSANPKSPTRLTTNALIAAAFADGL